MYYITVKDGKIKHAFEGDPQEGDIEISKLELDMVQACHGNLDNGINALVKVAEKILAKTLAEKKAVIFPEDKEK